MNKFTVIAKKASFWEVVVGKQKRIAKARFDEILTQKIVKIEKRETETVYHVEEREVVQKGIVESAENVELEMVLQGFTINQNGNFILFSGFNNGVALTTAENKKGFETIPINVARQMLNKSVCPLNAPSEALSKRHKRHINNFLNKIRA